MISVNENACNGLSEENDARAVLLLENMKSPAGREAALRDVNYFIIHGANERLLKECQRYAAVLPRTVYQQMYQTSGFTCLADFEQDSDLNTASVAGGRIETANLSEWTEERAVFGIDATKENYVMKLGWEDTREAEVRLNVPEQKLGGKSLVFDVADLSEDKTCAKEPYLVDGIVTLEDAKGNRASVRISDATVVYPSLPVRLNKLDYLFGGYQYKHPFQTVTIPEGIFIQANSSIDTEQIIKISIRFDYCDKGSLWLDNIGVE